MHVAGVEEHLDIGVEGAWALVVEFRRPYVDAGSRHPTGEVAGRMPPANVQHRPDVLGLPCGDQRGQCRRVAAGRLRLEPRGAGAIRGDRADAIGRKVAPGAARRELRHAVRRRERQRRHTAKIWVLRQRYDLNQRRDQDPEAARKRCGELRREILGLRARAGEKQCLGLGHAACLPVAPLRGAFAGVTCAMRIAQSESQMERVVLGIESSCDDTAVALVRATPGRPVGTILAAETMGQNALHDPYGGVVPEIAARAHAERLDVVSRRVLDQSGVGLGGVDAIAVTAGPGLIGGVLSGTMFAKGLAAARGLPLWGVNHLAGHALTPRLIEPVAFPYLTLLVSGGHCQILAVEGPQRFRRLGGTIDDAPGEAFDKVAKLLGLPQPGGPAVEIEAQQGDAGRFDLPRPLLDRDGCDLSFSGLKTAVRRLRDKLAEPRGGLTRADRADICAAFQRAVADCLGEKTRRGLLRFRDMHRGTTPVLAVAGGVAANGTIRATLTATAKAEGARFVAPPLALCTDNGAMIAWAATERMAVAGPDDATLVARPRWPLDTEAAPLVGAGRKGAKA